MTNRCSTSVQAAREPIVFSYLLKERNEHEQTSERRLFNRGKTTIHNIFKFKSTKVNLLSCLICLLDNMADSALVLVRSPVYQALCEDLIPTTTIIIIIIQKNYRKKTNTLWLCNPYERCISLKAHPLYSGEGESAYLQPTPTKKTLVNFLIVHDLFTNNYLKHICAIIPDIFIVIIFADFAACVHLTME